MRLRISPRAKADLDRVWDYVSPAGNEAADRFVAKIRKQCEMLARFPDMARPRNELMQGLQSFAVSPFIIFCRKNKGLLEILRILHGARNMAAIWKKKPKK